MNDYYSYEDVQVGDLITMNIGFDHVSGHWHAMDPQYCLVINVNTFDSAFAVLQSDGMAVRRYATTGCNRLRTLNSSSAN